MKIKLLLIGLMLVLALCISPVAAVSADDYEVVVDMSGDTPSYKYYNVNDPNEKYIEIFTYGTWWLNSTVTFKPVNITGPRVRIPVVCTSDPCYIYLPYSVDEWEIKYCSKFGGRPDYGDKHLKNKCVINLHEYFGDSISDGLYLELRTEQSISTYYCYYQNGIIDKIKYYIPSVK